MNEYKYICTYYIFIYLSLIKYVVSFGVCQGRSQDFLSPGTYTKLLRST